MAGERWNYQVIEIAHKMLFWTSKASGLNQQIQDELNRQGTLGWELVSVTQMPGTRSTHLYLKRAQ